MRVSIEVSPHLVGRLRVAESAIRGNAGASTPMMFSATQQTAAMAALLVLDALPVSPKVGQRVRSTVLTDLAGEVLFVHEASGTCTVLWDDGPIPAVTAYDRFEVLG